MRRYFAILAAALLLGGCSDKAAGDARRGGEPDSVSVALPQIRTVELTKSYPGYLTAADEVSIVARVQGRLVDASYEPGAVAKGDVLFRIDPTEYADAVSSAEASLQSAIAQRDYASARLDALQKALRADAVSRMEVEQQQSQLRQIEADIKTARAQLTDARTRLDYCTVRAPFAGRVAKRNFDPGAVVNPGDVLTSIYNEDHFSVNFEIEDKQYLAMTTQNGGKLPDGEDIGVDFGKPLAHDYVARLSYVAPNVDTGTGTYKMQARLDNPYGELRSGMYLTLNLPYARLDSALVVKAAAISTDQRGEFLYTVGDSGRVAYTAITSEPSGVDSLRVVTSGLRRGVPYVTKALLKVRPGMQIVPVYE